MYKKCKANVKCKIQGCTDRHHHLLHDMIIFRRQQWQIDQGSGSSTHYTATSAPDTGTLQDSLSQQGPSQIAYHGSGQRRALLQMLPIIVHGRNGTQMKLLALLDSGCDCTLLLHQMAQKLGVTNQTDQPQDIKITGVNGTKNVKSLAISEPIYVSPADNPYKKFALYDIQTVLALPGPSHTLKWSEIKHHF